MNGYAEPAGNYPALVRRLQERFSSFVDVDGIRPVVILDETHDIRPEVLGLFRILTNFEMDNRLVVSLILAGQAPLKKMLPTVLPTAPQSDSSPARKSINTCNTGAASPVLPTAPLILAK